MLSVLPTSIRCRHYHHEQQHPSAASAITMGSYGTIGVFHIHPLQALLPWATTEPSAFSTSIRRRLQVIVSSLLCGQIRKHRCFSHPSAADAIAMGHREPSVFSTSIHCRRHRCGGVREHQRFPLACVFSTSIR